MDELQAEADQNIRAKLEGLEGAKLTEGKQKGNTVKYKYLGNYYPITLTEVVAHKDDDSGAWSIAEIISSSTAKAGESQVAKQTVIKGTTSLTKALELIGDKKE